MTRLKFKITLLDKGFKFEKTTLSYPAWHGDEDIYTHKPEYKYTFRVFRMYRDKPDYGLYVGVGDQFRQLDAIRKHNIDLPGSPGNAKTVPLWSYNAFLELMSKLDSNGVYAQNYVVYKSNYLYNKIYESMVSNRTDSEIRECISDDTSLDDIKEVLQKLSNNQPPERVSRVVSIIIRNPRIRDLVKENKDYICEICCRKPFIQKNGKPYAEADHITPLGGIARGLDTPENMRVLCAQCHAVITHGSKDTIEKLFNEININ